MFLSIPQGIRYIIFATVFFSIINALVKYLGHIPAVEIIFFRSIVSLVITYISIRKLKIKIFNKYTPLLIIRGVSGSIALTLYFYTIQNMPLATAVTILYLAPIFTVIFAIFIVKEWPDKRQWPFFVLCFLGAALLKNFDPRVSLLHFSMGILAAMFAGIAYNMIRKLKNKVHHSLVIFYFPFITIPVLSPWIYKYWVTPNLMELLILLAIGICTQLAQVFMTKAYMLESAAKISHFNYLTCLFAFLTGIIFFNESLNTYSIVGLILIFIGIVFSSKFAPKS
jgi:drug/metabolite transporter (DMT)-like permease